MIEITETNTLIMEYFPLPIQTLAMDFLYRYITPIKTVWIIGQITHADAILNGSEEAMKLFAIVNYKSLLSTAESDDPVATLFLKALHDIKNVEIHECAMVRK